MHFNINVLFSPNLVDIFYVYKRYLYEHVPMWRESIFIRYNVNGWGLKFHQRGKDNQYEHVYVKKTVFVPLK